MSAWAITLISTGAALVSGLISASVNGWLSTRAKVNEELRVERLKAYPPIWERTRAFSRWPRNAAKYEDLHRFHLDLREWYYTVGGLYMSENGRARYGEVQELAAAHLGHRRPPTASLPDDSYDALMKTCSAFRIALTEDLESRRQRSLIWAVKRAFEHRKQAKDARSRIDVARSRAAPPETAGAAEPSQPAAR
jgi:hypothetical protein